MRLSSPAASLAATICLAVVACGPPGKPAHPASPWGAPSFFADIPADTPYVVAAIDPLSDALRTRLYRGIGDSVKKALALADKLIKPQDEPWKRAAWAIVEELRGTDPEKWGETLGFGPSPRIAIYGLGLFPVLRVEVADAPRMRKLVAKAIAAAGTGIATGTLGGITYWTFGSGDTSVVMAILDTEVVVAHAPAPQLQALLPQILGLDRPAKSLADVMVVPETLARYGFNRTVFAEVDVGRLGDSLAQLRSAPFGQCKDDFARLASYVPRLVAGYRHLDVAGYAVGIVVETSPAIADALAKIRAPIPLVPRDGAPLFELAAAVDVDGFIEAVRTAVHVLRNQPFHCAPLASMSESLDQLDQKLDEPLPPELRGLRGGDFVLDDFTASPPSGRGALLVVGAQLGRTIGQLIQKVPGFGSIAVPTDGTPVALPVTMFGLDSAHVAVRDTIAALAIGDHSQERVTKALAAPPDPNTPLVSFAWDFKRTIERMPSLWNGDSLAMMRNIGHVDLSLELRNGALDFELDAGWPN